MGNVKEEKCQIRSGADIFYQAAHASHVCVSALIGLPCPALAYVSGTCIHVVYNAMSHLLSSDWLIVIISRRPASALYLTFHDYHSISDGSTVDLLIWKIHSFTFHGIE